MSGKKLINPTYGKAAATEMKKIEAEAKAKPKPEGK